MKNWLSIFFLFSFAFATSTQVSSDVADWNGDELTLSSHVEVDHELGKILADEAIMKGDPLSELYLNGNVKLFSQKGGKLFCDSASFFQEKRLAHFSSEKALNYTQDDFEISCQNAECYFGKNMDLPRFTLFEIEHLLFMNHVHIRYGNEYSAMGGKAILKNIVGHDETFVQGTLTLFPQTPSYKCQLNHRQNQIFASQISMDLSRSEITCKFSSGSIVLPMMGKEILHTFSADHLFLKKDLGEMILKGNVTIIGAEGLEMTSDRMILTASESNYTITALGQTTFHFPQGSSLTCSGCVHWNNAENKIEMQAEKEPLIFEDEHITLLARQGTLLYDHDKEIKFQKVNFENEVKIITSEFEKGTSYGMADKVVYFPDKQQCILTAEDEHNVLFWNETDSIRLSASEIHIEEDQRTEQYHVEGKGKVRFTFDMEGEDVLKKFLSKYLDLKNRSSNIAEK